MNYDLLKTIEERMFCFSKGQKLIANYVLENYEKAAYLTAAKLGGIVGVSESTVVRFAIELGYDGYPAFQQSLRKIIRNRLTAAQRVEVTNNIIGDGNVLDKVLLSDAEKIRRTMEEIDHDSFETAIDRIATARRIYLLGMRGSAPLAAFLNHGLRLICDNVKFVQTNSGSEMFEEITHIGAEDVMIAISFPRYSKRVVNAVEYAKGKGANIVALTDSATSPIAKNADELLIAQSDMAAFMDSLVAPLGVINAMIVALSRKKQDELTARLYELEEVWDQYDVYDTKRK